MIEVMKVLTLIFGLASVYFLWKWMHVTTDRILALEYRVLMLERGPTQVQNNRLSKQPN